MRVFVSLIAGMLLLSCRHGSDVPDVSGISVPLRTLRFEEDLFSLDTNHIMAGADRLEAKYPSFGENYFSRILGLNPGWPPDTAAFYLKGFLAYSRNVYDSSEKLFHDFSPYEKQIKQALQYVKYYFPAYKVPTRIVTFIGPADGYGDGIADDELDIGLHAHLGKDFPLYKTDEVEDTYPAYVSARFAPAYIVVNCMKNVVNDMYPDRNEDKRLIIQMIEKGKRLYLLSKFLPTTDEYMLIGYTKKQLSDSYAREATIWDMFIQNNYLQIADNNTIKNYVSEGPKTPELGEGAPGNIGSFSGWQIVKKYMGKHPDLKPAALMAMDDETLFSEAKYKP